MDSQPFTGTYATERDGLPLVLSLDQAPTGTIRGRLSGNGDALDLHGLRTPSGLQGTLVDRATGQRLSFEARLQEDLVHLLLFPLDAHGQLDLNAIQSLSFARRDAPPAKEEATAEEPATAEEAPPPRPERSVVVNRQPLPPERLRAVEQRLGSAIPDGRYWYDARSGAWGPEGGPTAGFLAPGLPFPGPMPPDASGGGTGRFVNGREMHAQEVQALLYHFGMAPPGRYWLDAQGNLGVEGGPFLVNLLATPGAGGAGLVSGMGGTVGADGQGGFSFSARNADGTYTSWSN